MNESLTLTSSFYTATTSSNNNEENMRVKLALKLIHFFHDFLTPNQEFEPLQEQYINSLEGIITFAFAAGLILFFFLFFILMKRCFLPSFMWSTLPSGFHRRRANFTLGATSMEFTTVLILAFTALITFGGLIGETQLSSSANVVQEALMNSSHLVTNVTETSSLLIKESGLIQAQTNDFIYAFDDQPLPSDVYKLARETIIMTKVAKQLNNATHRLPQNLLETAEKWESLVYWVKSSTNIAVFAVTIACLCAILAIGWSMTSSLRFALLIALIVIPISHGLIGVYLSSSIATADFCIAPASSTMKFLPHVPEIQYFITCPVNGTSPYHSILREFNASVENSKQFQAQLEKYAASQGERGRQMQTEYLDPIGFLLQATETFVTNYETQEDCGVTADIFKNAVSSFCEDGIIGEFSLWVHQIFLCMLLVVCMICLALVFEAVRAKDEQMEMQYNLLSTYDEEESQHMYLSPE